MPYKPNPKLRSDVIADLSPRLGRATQSFAADLARNVSAGSRTGRQYPGLPRRSSAPTEFPQEQFGKYRESIEAQQTSDPLRWRVAATDPKSAILEFGTSRMEGRYAVTRTMESPDSIRRALEAMKGGGAPDAT